MATTDLGRVLTGYSNPYIAIYSESSGTVSYDDGQRMARGVSMSASYETTQSVEFYADNVLAEDAPKRFNKGTLTAVVDGLTQDAEQLLFGVPDPVAISSETGAPKFYHFGDDVDVPFVGFGCIARYQYKGVESFRPFVFRKVKFDLPNDEFETQGETVAFKTQSLTATIYRDDSAKHDFKWVGEETTTEAAAVAALRAALGITD